MKNVYMMYIIPSKNPVWRVQLGGETKLFGHSIGGDVPRPATIAYSLGGNVFLVALVEEPYLKMVKIFVTGETSFDWMEAKYSQPSSNSSCRHQSTFTKECYHGTSMDETAYNVQLIATTTPGT